MEVKRYLSLLWRWSGLIILGVLLVGGTTYLINRNTPPVYSASSRLLIDEGPGSSSGNDYSQILLEERLTQTYVEILKTRPVLQETIDRLELPYTTSQLANRVNVAAAEDTQIIIITVEDTNPVWAANIANMLGEVFIETNAERDQLRYAEPIANWQLRINEIGNELQEIETELNSFGEDLSPEEQARQSRLETQLNEARIRYTDAFNNLNGLQVSQAKDSSNIVPIEPAQIPSGSIGPRTTTNTIIASLVGGVLALGIIFLVEYLDDTVKTPDQVLEDTNLPTLGAIAQIKAETPSTRLITFRSPRDPISEAYRVLRTNLSFSAVDGGLHSLIVTSSSPGEGKSTTVANLAIVMAQTGKRVIVVDADLRRPMQHKIFEVTNNQGLTTAILDSKTPINYHLQQTKVPDLQILTSGPIPPNPAELLNSHRMNQVLEALKKEADVVIFDTPPALTVADASILAPQVNGCVLVVETGKTRRDAFIQAVERLDRASATIYGSVMNRLQPSRGGYYTYYYYHYYSAYEYSEKGRRSRSAMWLPAWLSGLLKRS